MNMNLVMLGLGAAAGVASLMLILEIWPLLAMGAAGYLILKGLQPDPEESI